MNIASGIIYVGSLLLAVSGTMYKEYEHHANLRKIDSLEQNSKDPWLIIGDTGPSNYDTILTLRVARLLNELPQRTAHRKKAIGKSNSLEFRGIKKEPCDTVTIHDTVPPNCPPQKHDSVLLLHKLNSKPAAHE